jgi:hypothetical protein
MTVGNFRGVDDDGGDKEQSRSQVHGFETNLMAVDTVVVRNRGTVYGRLANTKLSRNP